MAETITGFNSATGTAFMDLIRTEFANGYIDCFSGTEVAPGATTGLSTVVLRFTQDGGEFTPGTATNGLNFSTAASCEIEKDTETWAAEGGFLVASTAVTHARLYNNDGTQWIQFSVNTSGAVLNISQTSGDIGDPVTVSSFKFSWPATVYATS